MHRNHYNRGDLPLHTIDFSTLKKPNASPSCRLQQSGVQFMGASNSCLLLLGVFSILNQTVELNDAQFSEFPFESVPKQFQQFCHEKTFSEMFNILKSKGKTIESMVQILNLYPVLVCVLECWVRKKAITKLESNGSSESMGNQHQILVDMGIQIRGPLLGIIAGSLKIYVRIKFQIFPLLDLVTEVEEIGDVAAKWELQVVFKGSGVVSGAIAQREGEIATGICTASKGNQMGFLRRSKMLQGENQGRSGPQFKSAKKQRVGQCEKCGPNRRCECNQIKRRGFGMTPKNAQHSTSSVAHKGDPFAIGFLNEHNISKIRDSNPGQK